MLETLARFSFEFAKENFVFAKVWKVGYYESMYTLQLVQGYHLLPPGAPGPAEEWYRTLPFPS